MTGDSVEGAWGSHLPGKLPKTAVRRPLYRSVRVTCLPVQCSKGNSQLCARNVNSWAECVMYVSGDSAIDGVGFLGR